MKTILERLVSLENGLRVLRGRLDRHSSAILDEILPAIDRIKLQMEHLIVSNDRFMELERAVADVAIALYDKRTAKVKKADKRKTKRI